MNTTLHTIDHRPLFNQSSDSLLYAVGTIIDILEDYDDDMDDFIKKSFEKDVIIIFNEMAQRN